MANKKVSYTIEEKIIYFKYLLMKTNQEAKRLESIILRLESDSKDRVFKSSLKRFVKKGS